MNRRGGSVRTGSYVAGIDVGFSGAIVLMRYDRILKEFYDMPVLRVGKKQELDGCRIRDILYDVDHVFIEKAQVMPKQGIVSMGSYMKGFGIIIGICIGLQKPYSLVTPQAWKKEMMHGMQKEKEASILRVRELYPKLDLSRKKDHGVADAILIVLYGLKQIK